MSEVPSLRGSVVRASYDYLEKSLGAEFLQRTFARLSPEDRAAMKPPFLSLSWYPIKSVQQWAEAYEKELVALGKDPSLLKTEMRGSLGGMFRSLYSVIFSLFNPTSIIGRLPLITERVYNCIQVTVVENEKGRCLLRYQGPAEVYQYFRSTVLDGLIFILELGGVKNIQDQVTKESVEGDMFTLEIELTYKA
jgi:hypothetical protein